MVGRTLKKNLIKLLPNYQLYGGEYKIVLNVLVKIRELVRQKRSIFKKNSMKVIMLECTEIGRIMNLKKIVLFLLVTQR